MATLAQVASAVGVSIASVSKVLRGIETGTSAATRQSILATAEKLGYRRNLLVESIQTGKSLTIGVVIPPYGEFTRVLADAIHAHCVAVGLVPIFHWAKPTSRSGTDPQKAEDADARDEWDVLNRLLDRRVDGLLLYPAADGALASHFQECLRRNIPLVAIDRCPQRGLTDFIGTDDALGAQAAVAHLMALGHRHFIQLAGELRYTTYRLRAETTETAIRAAGGTCTTRPIANADHGQLLDHARALLAADPRATAAIVGSDAFAPALYRAALEAGRPVPTGLSIVGFAGLDLGLHLPPPLTTIAQNPRELGRQATELLCSRIGTSYRQVPARVRQIVPTLVVRGSTAVPAP